MAEDSSNSGLDALPVERRDLLAGAGAGALGVTAGCAQLLSGGSDGGGTTADTEAPPGTVPESTPDIVSRFAPDLHFGAGEQWFPTDPREYVVERDGESVVDGFVALDSYTRAYRESGSPPNPTVGYNVVDVSPDLTAVQYWMYSAFDQFTVNFHWHDWELLQVFVDDPSGDPVLVVASSHSRKVPNNEFLSPDLGADRPAILSEVGSHSSATSLNERETDFDRLPGDGVQPDITNFTVDVGTELLGHRLAYGLPRDEGMVLPYVVPEIDGAPLYEHPDLPNVSSDDLVAGSLVVRNLTDLASPPSDVPTREAGETFVRSGRDGGDHEYDLVSMAAMRQEIDGFDGPQLSFEFSIPTVVEDKFASHLTSVPTPWSQDRYADPVADVTSPNHVDALESDYDLGSDGSGSGNVVVGAVQEVTSGVEGDLRDGIEATEEISGEVDVSVTGTSVESVCLFESEQTAVPTSNGVVGMVGVEPGEHRLTVNGAGYAPYAEKLDVTDDDAPTAVGTQGRLSLVRNENATKLAAETAADQTALDRVRVTDDFAGPLYDSRPVGDREQGFGVYVHEEGTYSAEFQDEEGTPGAARVSPDDGDQEVALSDLSTGTTSLSSYLGEYLGDAATVARAWGASNDAKGKAKGVAQRFEAAAKRSREAANAAEQGRQNRADRALEATQNRLKGVLARIEAKRGEEMSEAVAAVLEQRATHADRKAGQARTANGNGK